MDRKGREGIWVKHGQVGLAYIGVLVGIDDLDLKACFHSELLNERYNFQWHIIIFTS